MNNKTEHWIQQKRGFGDWFDYAEKPDLSECHRRIKELKRLLPDSEFRCVKRDICETIIENES